MNWLANLNWGASAFFLSAFLAGYFLCWARTKTREERIQTIKQQPDVAAPPGVLFLCSGLRMSIVEVHRAERRHTLDTARGMDDRRL